MTAPGAELTPAAIQSADTGLNAYLEARARDYNTHGWSDDGVIETRDGRTLMAHHIDITLRRARTAERERNARTLEVAGLRSLLEDVATAVAQCREIGRPYGGDPVWSAVIARCDTILARVGAVIPQTVAETAQPDAERSTEVPAQPEPSNSSSPLQGCAGAAGALLHFHCGSFRSACGLTRQEDLSLGLAHEPDAVNCPRCLGILAGWAKADGRHADA